MFKPVILLLVLAFSAVATAKVDTYLSTDYIDITADSPEDFLAKLKVVDAPISGDGYGWLQTETQNSTSYKTTNQGCKLSSINSELNFTMTLPRWENVDKQSKAHQLWWSKVIKFINNHELAHQQIVIDATQVFQVNAKAMEPQVTCKDAKKRYRVMKRKLSGKIRDKDYSLDYKNNARVKIKDFLNLDIQPDTLADFDEKGFQNQ
ncbi:MAG: DUF922 domain-containing protein [Algicola sp.]|nr:DUF922 domain-containing protein [Algicola sp.]